MSNEIKELWPELEWIEDENLRRQTEDTWRLAVEQSKLTIRICMRFRSLSW